MTRLLAGLVSIYQAVLRPLLPRACRFHPSCSDYARDAWLKRGALMGTALLLRRLSRCHPFHPGGYDPVPHHG